MVDIEKYISCLIVLLREQFGEKLLYVGLQGSYLRGEATDNSDIDIMVIIDDLQVADLMLYRKIIQSMDSFDKSCGFICGKNDLANWNPLEICHLLHTTKDCYGILKELIPAYSAQDIKNFIKISINNLYHEICHRYIHSTNNTDMTALINSYKGIFFILQNLYYLQYGKFPSTKSELIVLLDGPHRTVLERSIELHNGVSHDFQDCFILLFKWCQDTLQEL